MRRLTQIFLIKVKELSKRILLYLYWFPGFYRWSFLFSGTRRVVGRGKMQRGSARHSWVPGLSWGRFSNLFPCPFLFCPFCNDFFACPVRLKKSTKSNYKGDVGVQDLPVQIWTQCLRAMLPESSPIELSSMQVINVHTFCDIMLPLLSKSSTCSGFVPYITVRT